MHFSLRKLMHLYIVVFSVIIFIAAAYFVKSDINTFNSEQEEFQNNVITRVSNEIQKNDVITNNIANYISENGERILNIDEYLKNNPAQYSEYVLKQKDYFNWPNVSKNFYIQYPNLDKLEVRLSNNNYAFQSSINNTTGRIIKISHNKEMRYMFMSSIVNPDLQEVAGVVATKFNDEELNNNLRHLSQNKHLQLFVLGAGQRTIYHFSDPSVTLKEKKEAKDLIRLKKLNSTAAYSVKVDSDISGGYKIITLLNSRVSLKRLQNKILLTILVANIVLIAMYISFWAIFNNYKKQLIAIIDTTKKVSNDNLNARVTYKNNHFSDLNLLSHSINKMLDDINNYINTIYKMKIAQQDAQMKALQAQISPHFMANTLEYIRMACLTNGDRDLAKVVYSFAALLRENVGNNIQTTLKQEAKLVRNYIYLYQVRFPDKLAFQVDIDPQLYQVKIPKFTLQPIVENYFKHGVDFAQNDNAIEIKGRLIDGRVNLWVIDNGRNLSLKELSRLNLKLQEPIVGNHSVGLPNVYARMNNYTKHFKMMITNNEFGGITVKLSFDSEG